MEGLEISEVKLSDAVSITGDRRLDSEYYLKKYVQLDSILKHKKTSPFKGYCNFIKKGIFDLSPEKYTTHGIPFIRTSEIKNPQIDFSTTVFIDITTHTENSKTSLKPRDLVFTKIGAYIGDVAMLPSNYSDYNFSQNVAGASLKDEMDGPYLLTFFLSELGKSQILRSLMLSGQGKLELEDIRNYRIPTVSDAFKQRILEAFNLIESKQIQSKSLYSEAELILLSELGLKDWQPNNNPINIKQLKESFLASGRLDAEYYQPKYDEIESVVTKYKNGSDTIKNLFAQNTEVCNYKEKAYNYIEIGDINTSNGTANYNLISTEDLPDNAKRVIHYGDILISKVRPYRGAVSIIDFEIDNLIASGAFTVLHEKTSYKKEVLQVLLRTQIYKDWLLKWNVGSSYPVIKDEDIMELPIPIIPQMVQSEIAEYVQKSIALRNEAKQLLENAKLQVENEISWGGGN